MATLELLVEHMNVVWDALTQSDDLVMIKDLRAINDMKNLLSAIEDFKKIMSKSRGVEIHHVEHNPLLNAKGTAEHSIAEYEKINANQRIFGQYQMRIDESDDRLLELKNK